MNYRNTLSILILFLSICAQGQDLSELFSTSVKSVVTIFTTELKFESEGIRPQQSLGSGVIISADGLIMTAAHVVETANLIQVKLYNGITYEAEIIRSIPSADIALIKIKDALPGLNYSEISNPINAVKTGHQVYVIGSPRGIEQSLSSGYVSGFLNRSTLANGNMAKFIQTDASINSGNSGGPMFNMNGKIIGIVSYILTQSGGFDGIGYVVDIQTAKELLLDDDSHFWSGFDGYLLDENISAILNVPQNSGLLIQRVSKGSFADEMGLQGGFFQTEILDQKLWLGGDIILEILGCACDKEHSIGTIKKEIRALKSGQTINLKVLRRGEIVVLQKTI